ECVHQLGAVHHRRHRAERQAAEIDVRAREDHPDAAIGERVGDLDDAVVEELRLVHGDDLRGGADALYDVGGAVNGLGLDGDVVVRGDVVEPGITGVEVGLEDLDLVY